MADMDVFWMPYGAGDAPYGWHFDGRGRARAGRARPRAVRPDRLL